MSEDASTLLSGFIVDRIEVGIFALNQNLEVVMWNHFMADRSGMPAKEVLGRNLFECFPDLPRSWLERKIRNVFILKNFSFTSWRQRPYLFKFTHNRPVTGGVDCMRQNCTFLPVKNPAGEVEQVCVTLFDATDESMSEENLQQTLHKLADASIRDGLTGIYNRRHLEAMLVQEFSRVKRYGDPMTFIMLDLDHFKKINDGYGHLAGDEVLKITAQRLQTCLRQSDLLGRYGGEEFGIILPETDMEGAIVVAERLRIAMASAPIAFQDTAINATISVGVARFRADHDSYEKLIGEADAALYQSKKDGRNRFTCFVPPQPSATA